MKVLAIFTLAAMMSTSTFAGMMELNCEAFRVSQDTNKNIQSVKIAPELNGVSLNGSEPLEVIDGALMNIPTIVTLKGVDGKGDYTLDVKVKSKIASINGHIAIGRDHDIDLSKVEIFVSRNGKTHLFVGTCKEELITTCGGACAPESSERDVL